MLYSVPLGNLTAERLQRLSHWSSIIGYHPYHDDVQNKYGGSLGEVVGMVRSLVSNKGEENGYRLKNSCRPRG